MPINELRAIGIFIQTAEQGSLRKAAATQGVTPQAASQALAQLEQHLGVRLFHRTTRNMALTAEGQQLLDAVRPPTYALQRALQGVRLARDDIAGPLRIIGPRSTFRPVIWSLLDEFCQAHPDIQPDVQLDDRIGNWVEDRVDVGFRIGASAAEGVVARRLFPLQLIICAAPAYLERHGAPAGLEDLGQHRCSAFRHPVTGRVVPWHLKIGDAIVDHEVVPALFTNDEDLEIDAVMAGQVIGVLTGVTAAAHIRSGRLVPLLTPHMADHMSLHLYYGSRSAQPSRVRAFIELAIARLTDSAEFTLGAKELAAAEARGRKAAKARARG
ncbi:LysR family transcriptional regulator [Roseateles aquatilis]|uniref:LysR family transcriptional regulator n=1 Tax=Roseateles aquatilis TaxID=431061 RepID=A0A246IZN1_9BURK|nr:LysR family transcriptional regulator [Roseateles aquatilis]OWQ85672.1 LysR family transcriptional regulator [Roseateles aquatilis]